MFISKNEKSTNTDYIEFQICKLSLDTSVKDLVSIKNIIFNDEFSIYLDFKHYDFFYSIYASFFTDCIHNDLSIGNLDPYGVNYYTLSNTLELCKKICVDKPNYYEILIDFLNKAKENNGFYILGI